MTAIVVNVFRLLAVVVVIAILCPVQEVVAYNKAMDKLILINNVNSPPILIYRKGSKRKPGKLILING